MSMYSSQWSLTYVKPCEDSSFFDSSQYNADMLGATQNDYDSIDQSQESDHLEEVQPPLPDFLTDTIQELRRKIPGVNIEGCLQAYPIHLANGTLSSHPPNVFDPSRAAVSSHYVAMIRCLDCSHKPFPVSPFESPRPIKDHLNLPGHYQLRLHRKHEAFVDAHGGSPWPSIQQLDKNTSKLGDQSLLILAVKKYDVQVLGRLLKDGFKVQEKDTSQRSALHWACVLGRLDMAELLVQYGAELGDRDAESQTPIDLALQMSGVAAAMSLIEVLAQI